MEKKAKTEKEIEEAGADDIVEELGGCGRFQFFQYAVFAAFTIPDVFTFFVLTFGVYNPGWKCLDTNVGGINGTQLLYGSGTGNNTAGWETENCTCFESCNNIEFHPGVSTIVTEWGLTCNKASIVSTTIAISNAGGLVGNLVVGYVGDKYGRKMPTVVVKVIQSVLNIAIIYSPSWEVHAILSFVLGVLFSFTYMLQVLLMEYTPADFRLKINSLPVFTLITLLFSLTAMYTEDWRILRWIAGITGFVFLVPFVYVQKSLRWLYVKGRDEEGYEVAVRIANINRVKVPSKERIDALMTRNDDDINNGKNTTMLDLFRKGYRFTTFVIGCTSFTINLIYYVTQFGIAVLPGNIYVNLLIVNGSELPSNIICYLIGERFRRKSLSIFFFVILTLCFFAIVAVVLTISKEERTWPIVGLVLLLRVFLNNCWILITTIRMEVYPTIARGTVTSYHYLVGSVASVIAPYMIGENDSKYWISNLALGIASFICTCFILYLPETKDKPMKETWDDNDEMAIVEIKVGPALENGKVAVEKKNDPTSENGKVAVENKIDPSSGNGKVAVESKVYSSLENGKVAVENKIDPSLENGKVAVENKIDPSLENRKVAVENKVHPS